MHIEADNLGKKRYRSAQTKTKLLSFVQLNSGNQLPWENIYIVPQAVSFILFYGGLLEKKLILYRRGKVRKGLQ